MDVAVNEFVDGLLNENAHERPSDSDKEEDLQQKMQLPDWFDEEEYNKGRSFFWAHCFGFSMSMMLGGVATLCIPSLLKILVSTGRSNSTYTAYYRFSSTFMHVVVWLQHELKPGTMSWKSLYTVRSRHIRAGKEASLKGLGTVSQRDMALSLMGFLVFGILKPDKFSIKENKSGDWECYNHFWRTIGYMVGLENRYNICRKNVAETREVCRILQARTFTPCLENVPEYFEHSARSLLSGVGILNSQIEASSTLFLIKYLADVPGYVLSETERIVLQNRLRKHLNGQSEDIGVDVSDLMQKSAVSGLPDQPPRYLYLRDFDCIETTPAYKQLNFAGRYRLAVNNLLLTLYGYSILRYIFNMVFLWNTLIGAYFPYKAFMKLGIKKSFVNIFAKDPKDDTKQKRNVEYNQPPPPDTWRGKLLTVLW